MGTADPAGHNIRRFAHVKITSKARKLLCGQTGTVVKIEGDLLWIAFPGGSVKRFRSSSVRVITRSPRFRESD